MLGRRQFMASLGGMGLGIFLTKDASAIKPPAVTPNIEYFPYLVAAINEHHRLWGTDDLWYEELISLACACEKIQPATHGELAACVARMIHGMEIDEEIVDEYVRRKNGLPPLLDDHPLLDLPKHGVPATFRVLIYVEQLQALYQELTDCPMQLSFALLKRFSFRWQRNKSDIEQLRTIVTAEYKERFAEKELRILARILGSNYIFAKPYTVCSIIADRAENLARAEMAAMS